MRHGQPVVRFLYAARLPPTLVELCARRTQLMPQAKFDLLRAPIASESNAAALLASLPSSHLVRCRTTRCHVAPLPIGL